MIKQAPIALETYDKRDVRSQFAALCYRVKNKRVEVLMITSRRSGRWIVPKGWPMPGKTPAQTAATEAWEEAGVHGKVHDQCLGVFSYHKAFTEEDGAPCLAMVYPVKVKALATKYPEAGQRRRKWMSLKKAADKVAEPELAQILKQFKPSLLLKL